jgi:hypothetical protein
MKEQTGNMRTTAGTVLVLCLTLLCSGVLAQDTVRVVELKELDELPPIYIEVAKAKFSQTGEILEPARYEQVIKEQKAVNLMEGKKPGMTNPADMAIYVVGGIDLYTYYYVEISFPDYFKDVDGGTIRLIMQHETDVMDQARIIDEYIGTEVDDDSWGRRGRHKSRYGWTRQSGGGNYSWRLGDMTAHYLARPWDWAWITDFRWGQGKGVLPKDVIRIYSHPHVTTRVILKD